MTWSLENSKGDESSKIRWELVPYMNGRCLDLGCGPYKTFPHFIGVDNGHHDKAFGWKNKADVIVETCERLDLFADESCDAVFSSHLLEHIYFSQVPNVLDEWLRVTKQFGHLILYLPDANEYPKCGTQHANPDHKWDVTYEKVVDALEQSKYSWDMIDFQVRHDDNEYSLFFVVKKI